MFHADLDYLAVDFLIIDSYEKLEEFSKKYPHQKSSDQRLPAVTDPELLRWGRGGVNLLIRLIFSQKCIKLGIKWIEMPALGPDAPSWIYL